MEDVAGRSLIEKVRRLREELSRVKNDVTELRRLLESRRVIFVKSVRGDGD
jgi:hypothetical protein